MTSQFIRYFARRAESIRLQLRLASESSWPEEKRPPSDRPKSPIYFTPSPISPGPATSSVRSSAVHGASSSVVKDEGGLVEFDGEPVDNCAFCEIVKGNEKAYKVYEDDKILAFLDILPIRPAHLLVIPKRHYARVSHMPDELSAALGRALPRISRAMCRATNQPDFNIISNQGYAQIVHHLHFHLVPAPLPSPSSSPTTSTEGGKKTSPPRSGWASILGRDELDEEEGEMLAKKIRDEVEWERATVERRKTKSMAKL